MSMAEDREAYRRPCPMAVAKLIASHGAEAAKARWWFIEKRSLDGIARQGRAMLGMSSVHNNGRQRSTDPITEAVAIEAAFILQSRNAGARAAGIHDSRVVFIEQARGLDDVPRSKASRGKLAVRSKAAKAGDIAAQAELDAERALEQAVGSVLRIALGMIERQPETGRFVLPGNSPELRAALDGQDPAAVELAFPGLLSAPVPVPTVSAIEEPVMPRKRLPADDQIRADFAAAANVHELAETWGVSTAAVYNHLRRLGLSFRPKAAEAEAAAPATGPANVVPFEAAAPVIAETRSRLSVVPGATLLRPLRLGLDDLALSWQLASRLNLSPAEALAIVRADVALAHVDTAGVEAA